MTPISSIKFNYKTTLELEHELGFPSVAVVGIDEVGRGCIAGPVYAGAVLLPPLASLADAPPFMAGVTDSKLVSEENREDLAPLLQGWVRAYGIGIATVEEIERLNILHAAMLAMRRAWEALVASSGVVGCVGLVDGNRAPVLPGAARVVTAVKGDLRSLTIASASILAKTARDGYMREQDGFAKHKGYGTPEHLRALSTLGCTPLHRRAFAPVKAVLGMTKEMNAGAAF